MNCLITAGPSYEPLDEVRRLTNFSTGELGCLLADKLVASGHNVTLLLGAGATYRKVNNSVKTIEFTTSESLKNILFKLKEEGQKFDAIFHAAAICDYRVERVFIRNENNELIEIKAKKIPTHYGRIHVELAPTEKIIVHLRPLFPTAFIFGWKYEADGDRETAIEAGEKQMEENDTNACVINGPAFGKGFGILFKGVGPIVQVWNKDGLVFAINDLLNRIKKRIQ